MKREAQVAREEAEARRQDELERQRREAAAREAAAREAERRARERQEREAEMRRRREAEMQQQARENSRSRADFKPYMPRIWPQLSATQAKKKTTFLKRLRSLRTTKKRAQDAGRSVSSYNAKIEDIFREAWAMHRDVSSDTTA